MPDGKDVLLLVTRLGLAGTPRSGGYFLSLRRMPLNWNCSMRYFLALVLTGTCLQIEIAASRRNHQDQNLQCCRWNPHGVSNKIFMNLLLHWLKKFNQAGACLQKKCVFFPFLCWLAKTSTMVLPWKNCFDQRLTLVDDQEHCFFVFTGARRQVDQ